jgi:hypothetical protein
MISTILRWREKRGINSLIRKHRWETPLHTDCRAAVTLQPIVTGNWPHRLARVQTTYIPSLALYYLFC